MGDANNGSLFKKTVWQRAGCVSIPFDIPLIQSQHLDIFLSSGRQWYCIFKIVGEDGATEAPETSPSPPECFDAISIARCEALKIKGRCWKQNVKEKCKATCGFCTMTYPAMIILFMIYI